MNQKYIALIIIVIGLSMGIFNYVNQQSYKEAIRIIVEEQGSCFLDDGTCLHEENSNRFIIGWVLSASLIILGAYMLYFNNSFETIIKKQKEVSDEIKKVKEEEKQKDEFKAYLSGFNENEQKVIKAIKEQEGIQQSTLRFRTATSKTSLSLMLEELEKKGIIKREPYKKTNKIFLIKKY